jgi:peptidoglycan hydrolase-like protein with peptidoglycan-binding domain
VGDEPSSNPLASDCSGEVYGVYRKAGILVNGKPLPRETADDYYHRTSPIKAADAKCGDLGFLMNGSGHVYHTFLVLGPGKGLTAQVVEAGFNHKVRLTTVAVENVRSGIRWGRLNTDIGELTPAVPPPREPLRVGGLFLVDPHLHGHDVSWTQHCLWKAGIPGFDDHQVDGDFGPITEAALKTFQTRRKLPVTGKVDDATYAALNAVPGI